MTLWIETEPDGDEVLVEERVRPRAARIYDWIVVAVWIGSGLFILVQYLQLVVVPAVHGRPTDAVSAAIMTLLFVLPGTALVVAGARAGLAGVPRTTLTREVIDADLREAIAELPDEHEAKRLLARHDRG